MPIVHQIATAAFATSTGNATANATSPALGLGVVCAWPVSGQYGPGSRVLYYVLVATCVFARKAEWLRDACLAAALLFPAVAALHGLVLAALHVNGPFAQTPKAPYECLVAQLTTRYRRHRHGCLWRIPAMLDRHSGRPHVCQAVQDVLS